MKTIYKDARGQFIIAEQFIRYTVISPDLSVDDSLISKEKTPEDFKEVLEVSGAKKISEI